MRNIRFLSMIVVMLFSAALLFTACVDHSEKDTSDTVDSNTSIPELKPAETGFDKTEGSEVITEDNAPSDTAANFPPSSESEPEVNDETDPTEPYVEPSTIPVEEEGTVEVEPGQGVGGL